MKTPKIFASSLFIFASLMVQAQLVADFSFTVNGTCAPVTVTFTDQSTGNPTSWQWDFGDGSVGNTPNPTHSYTSPGVYFITLTVMDSIGSSMDTASVDLVGIHIGPSVTPDICGACSGAISLNPSGGTPPYTVIWGNGDTSSTRSNLCTGLYNVTVSDSSGCSRSQNIVVNNQSTLQITASTINVSCNGNCDGSIQLNITSGQPPYNYQWNSGASNPLITNLCPGTYSITVTDAAGCSRTGNYTITEPAPLQTTGWVSSPICAGDCSGAIDLSTTGGTPPYSFMWNGGIFTTEDLSGICAGTYEVMITDAIGCVTIDSFWVADPPPLSLTMGKEDATCGQSDGRAWTTVTGGGSPYSYNWSNGVFSTNDTILGLSPGAVSVTVVDFNGCDAVGSVLVEGTPSFNLTASTTNSSCGLGNGTATVSITGGIAPFTFQWNDPGNQTTATASNLAAGTYEVIVTDSTGCSNTTIALVNDNGAPVLSSNTQPATCQVAANGTIDLVVDSGAAPYSYFWNTGDSMQDLIDITPGSYTVTVTDANGCIAVHTTVINIQSNLSISDSVTDAACSGTATGAIDLLVSGDSPFLFMWSNGNTVEDLNGISPGPYQVTVTDANGCTGSYSTTVGLQSTITISGTVTPTSCQGGDGAIDITTNGGNPPFTFQWSSGITTANINNLVSGTYGITITDTNGCTASNTFFVPNGGTTLTISGTTTNPSCQSPGAIDITVTGGTAPFTYLWSNGDTTRDLLNITAGSYFITVTDSNGCSITRLFSITDPVFNLSFTSTPAGCGLSTGSATALVSGTVLPVTYKWSDGHNTQTADSLAAGWYSVTVTDSSGCHRHINAYVPSVSSCYVTISGIVYHDANSNCVIDSTETVIPNVKIDITRPNGYTFTRYTYTDGSYYLTGPPGNYTLTMQPDPRFNIVCPPSGSYTFNLPPFADSTGNDFAVTINPRQDLRITMYCGPARPGLTETISATIYNDGSLPTDAYVEMVLDNRLSYSSPGYNSPPPDSSFGNKLYWHISNLGINQYRSLSVYALVPTPPQLNVGDVLYNSVKVYPFAGDIDTTNNSSWCSRSVTNSCDPNDKAVFPSKKGISQNDSLLQYTIRFQNTGNDTAFTVVIKDTLNQNLDYSTFKQGTASHPYEVHFEFNNVVVFTFKNIMLPDSNVNEKASHGHVSFYIGLKESLLLGTAIMNDAAIYFDYNQPVITNQVINQIVEVMGIKTTEDHSGIIIYPNPAYNELILESNIKLENSLLSITDLTGRIVKEELIENASQRHIDIKDLNTGVYVLTLEFPDKGKTYHKFIKMKN